MAQAIREGSTRRDICEQFPREAVKYHSGMEYLYQHKRRTRRDPTEIETILYYGPPGCGKTRAVEESEANPDDLWVQPITDGIWMNKYDNHPAALLDDFDGRMSKYPLKHLLRLLDIYTLDAPVKGGFTEWRPKRVHITTNYHPREWYDWNTREPQWGALVRRFSKVVVWNSTGSENRVLSAGTPEFEAFFNFDPATLPPNPQPIQGPLPPGVLYGFRVPPRTRPPNARRFDFIF